MMSLRFVSLKNDRPLRRLLGEKEDWVMSSDEADAARRYSFHSSPGEMYVN